MNVCGVTRCSMVFSVLNCQGRVRNECNDFTRQSCEVLSSYSGPCRGVRRHRSTWGERVGSEVTDVL